MTKIILHGCNGRMGQVICGLIAEDENVEVVAGVDISNHISNPFPVFSTISECDVDADVIIDFSHPSVLEDLLNFAKSKKIPAVIATTGLNEQQIENIKTVSDIVKFIEEN